MKNIFAFLLVLVTLSTQAQADRYSAFTQQTDQFLKSHVTKGFIDYEKAQGNKSTLASLSEQISSLDLTSLSDDQKIAFYINAYNITVIESVVASYPIPSVMEIGGFFDRKKHTIAGQSITLNHLEKNILLKKFPDARYHFVLVCGAVDCPQISNKAITANGLSDQLNEATNTALNADYFIREKYGKTGISEIFKWYQSDFGGSKSSAVDFINKYRDSKISGADTYFYEYNWSLNDTKNAGYGSLDGANANRYVTSAAISEGGVEVKLFNNLYTQNDGSRSTYLTSNLSFLYGLNNRFNIGFTGRYRRVLNASADSSPLDVLGSVSGVDGRQRISAFGPQIRWAPFKSLGGFSIQSSLTFPIGDQLTGSEDAPFLDWDGPVFLTQFFYDQSIGDKFSVFTEVDIIAEEIGGAGKSNRVSLPVTSIFSWYPKQNVTIYGLAGFSPFVVSPFDYFVQAGIGFKYQVTPNFEIELLSTAFTNKYLVGVDGNASTYNIGVRYSR